MDLCKFRRRKDDLIFFFFLSFSLGVSGGTDLCARWRGGVFSY